MALVPLSAAQLAGTPTLFASFMGRAGSGYRTVAELLAIYRERRGALARGEDRDDDLRVERFIADMASRRWEADVVVRVGVFDEDVLVVDGIHRSIAYLACVEAGLAPERLPALHVEI